MRYVPSPLCSDEEFIRRACLDATGTLPKPEEVEAFLADSTPSREKRRKYIDDLLDRPEFADLLDAAVGRLASQSRSVWHDQADVHSAQLGACVPAQQ